MSYLVKDYMDKEFPTLDVSASITEASKVVAEGNKGYTIILENGKIKGIVTEWDLVSKILAAEKDPKNVNLKEILTSQLLTIDPDEDLLKASAIMQQKGVKRLPVVKSGIVYGVLTSQNIAQQCAVYVNKSVKDILRWSTPIM